MKKYKIISGVVIVAILALAFLWGGNAPGLSVRVLEPSENTMVRTSVHLAERKETDDVPIKEADSSGAEAESKPQVEEKISVKTAQSDRKPDDTEKKGKNQAEVNSAEKPMPIESQKKSFPDNELTCTLSVRCDTILGNIAWLDDEKVELVPSDGVIYEEKTVTFHEGESVFDLLVREMNNSKIHMEYENTPIYNSAYIEGIGNLYEFDCGELSGWMYKVNGALPNYGCSRYQLKAGDKIEWVYTCNLGADVGGEESAQDRT